MAKSKKQDRLKGAAIIAKKGSKPATSAAGRVAASMNEREIKGKKKDR